MPSRRRCRPPCSHAEAAGRDLLVSAQTGSGKTVAFGLAMAPDAARRGAALRPRRARRWRWSSRRPASWRCRSSASSPGSTPPPAPASSPASAAWTSAREQRALAQGAHIVVGTPGPPARPPRARPSRHLGAARRRARRGRRDARPGLSRGPRVHPRRHAGRAPHAAVLGHHPQGDRGPRQALPARRAAHRHHRRARAARRHRVPRAARSRPNEREHAVVNLLRFFEAPGALRVLLDPRGGAPPARAAWSSAASPPWRCRAS